jgi:glutamate racemase
LQESLKGSEYHDCKILGVVIPTIEALVDSGIPRAVLIGTTRTVTSGKYERELIKLSSEIEIVGYATPTLVALIESNNIALAQKQADALIKLFEREGDVLVLGCTHYTVLKEHIRQKTKMQVISQDEVIPIKLKNYLERHPEIESKLSRNGTVEVILSEENLEYRNRIEILLTT